MYICVHVDALVCIGVCMHESAIMRVSMYMYVCMYVYICVHVDALVCTGVCMHERAIMRVSISSLLYALPRSNKVRSGRFTSEE